MADIHAFRGYRYDLGRVGALRDVIAPPYDVIDAELQEQLYQRSPYNVIRLELNREEPGDNEINNRYTRAAAFLRDWLQQGILVQDSARSLYVYHQEFEVEGRTYTRRGFMARVRLEKFGAGRIYPHEQTMSGPKADRLKLLHATGMNLSQIFGLYPDPEGEVQARLDAAVGRSLPLQATDHLGVVSKLWPIADQHVISAVTGLMGPRPIFIADGHHRYETGLRYLEEKRASGEVQDDGAPPNFILMMLVSMSDPGLVILPTHRLVTLGRGLRSAELLELLGRHFTCEQIGSGEAGARDTWELMEADGSQRVLGFGTVADGEWHLARFRCPELMAELAPDHSPAWRELGVAVLHEVVLGKLINDKLRLAPQCRYVHLLREVTEACSAQHCDLAVLVPPARLSQLEQIAGNLEKMPPKSTYFYPKLLSGLVFNSLRGH